MSLHITFLRHGEADKSLPNHRLHPLSAKGREQAKERRAQLGNPQFDLVIHSPLLRTKQTACLVAGLEEDAQTIVVSDLFPQEEDPRTVVLNQAFEKLGHASLHRYYEEAGREMQSLGNDAAREIREAINQSNASNVLVVGHGMLLQVLCIAFTGKDNPFMDQVLNECQGCCLFGEEVTEIK